MRALNPLIKIKKNNWKVVLLILSVIISRINVAQTTEFKAVWAKTGFSAQSKVKKIKIDPNGNYVVAGYYYAELQFDSVVYTDASSYARDHFFLAKITPNADLIWIKHTLGNGNCTISDIDIDKNGNIYLAGNFSGGKLQLDNVVTYKAGRGRDCFLAKYNNEGKLEWLTTIDGGNSDELENVVCIGKQIYLSGFSDSRFVRVHDAIYASKSSTVGSFIVKFDSSGQLEWLKTLNSKSRISGLSCDSSSLYLAGQSSDSLAIDGNLIGYSDTLTTLFLAKFDQNFNLIWKNLFAFAEKGSVTSLATNLKGECLLSVDFETAVTLDDSTFFNRAFLDGLIVKFTSLGGVFFTKTYSTFLFDKIVAVQIDDSGQSMVLSERYNRFGGPFCMDYDLPSPFPLDVIVLLEQLDQNGTKLWSRKFGSEKSCGTMATEITIADKNAFLIGGLYSGKIEIDNIDNLNEKYTNTYFILKFIRNENVSQASTVQHRVYPTITDGPVFIESSEKTTEIFLSDFQGRRYCTIIGPTSNLDFDLVPAGTYILDVKFQTGRLRQKIIILR